MGTAAQVKQHDYGLPLIVDLNYRNTALDLTDTLTLSTPTVFTMTPEGSVAPVIYRAPATVTALDTPNKTVTVQYDWRPPNLPTVSGDTEIAGRYKAEFEFDLTGGPATAPTGGYLAVYILPDLDSTAADLPANTVTAIDAHVAQADPHPGYTTTAELAAAAALLAPIASPAFTGVPTAPTLSLTGTNPALTIGTAAGSSTITLNANVGSSNVIDLQRVGVSKWWIYDANTDVLYFRDRPNARMHLALFPAATAAAALMDVYSSVRIAGNVGFYGSGPVAKPTGVAVSAPGIHAALVTLGLIAA